MWLAHALTLARIPLAIAIVAVYGHTWPVIALLAIAAATDALDGTIARLMQRHGHTRPAIGGWLDPLCDKLFVAIVLVAVAVHTGGLLVVALIGARELLLVPLVAVYLATHPDHPSIHADPIGKVATIAQFVALAIAIATPERALPAALGAAVLGIAATVHYVRARRMQPA